jgi:hypothetical protein
MPVAAIDNPFGLSRETFERYFGWLRIAEKLLYNEGSSALQFEPPNGAPVANAEIIRYIPNSNVIGVANDGSTMSAQMAFTDITNAVPSHPEGCDENDALGPGHYMDMKLTISGKSLPSRRNLHAYSRLRMNTCYYAAFQYKEPGGNFRSTGHNIGYDAIVRLKAADWAPPNTDQPRWQVSNMGYPEEDNIATAWKAAVAGSGAGGASWTNPDTHQTRELFVASLPKTRAELQQSGMQFALTDTNVFTSIFGHPLNIPHRGFYFDCTCETAGASCVYRMEGAANKAAELANNPSLGYPRQNFYGPCSTVGQADSNDIKYSIPPFLRPATWSGLLAGQMMSSVVRHFWPLETAKMHSWMTHGTMGTAFLTEVHPLLHQPLTTENGVQFVQPNFEKYGAIRFPASPLKHWFNAGGFYNGARSDSFIDYPQRCQPYHETSPGYEAPWSVNQVVTNQGVSVPNGFDVAAVQDRWPGQMTAEDGGSPWPPMEHWSMLGCVDEGALDSKYFLGVYPGIYTQSTINSGDLALPLGLGNHMNGNLLNAGQDYGQIWATCGHPARKLWSPELWSSASAGVPDHSGSGLGDIMPNMIRGPRAGAGNGAFRVARPGGAPAAKVQAIAMYWSRANGAYGPSDQEYAAVTSWTDDEATAAAVAGGQAAPPVLQYHNGKLIDGVDSNNLRISPPRENVLYASKNFFQEMC